MNNPLLVRLIGIYSVKSGATAFRIGGCHQDSSNAKRLVDIASDDDAGADSGGF
jgi:hypothetical protein